MSAVSLHPRQRLALLAAILTLAFAALAAAPASAQTIQARTTSDLNARSGPGNEYPVLYTIPRNTVLTVIRCTADRIWCEAQYGVRTGWSAARYLEAIGTTTIPTPTPTPTPVPTPTPTPVPTPTPAQPAQPGQPQIGQGALFDYFLNQLFGQPTPAPVPTQPVGNARPRTPADNEVCFFKEADFQGDFFCARMGQSDANLAADWNDQISSLRVGASATVQVCGEINFTGWCQTYVDDIARLGANRNDSISSYRAIDLATATPTPVPTPTPTPVPVVQVCFYEGVYYSGASLCLAPGQAYPFLPTALNNRISSIRIEGNIAVQVCEDYNYNGWCEEYRQSLPQLGPGRDDAISSVRVRAL